jgi:hypothetical protein
MLTPQPETFRRSVDSGLLLPPELSRERQVWTKDEWRLLERLTKLLKARGVNIQLQCDHETCKGQPIEGSRLSDGSFQLRCEHADRVMVKHF